MKRTLLAACAAVAICGAVPVVSTPAHAQAEKSTYDLFDMMYRLVREEGAENVANLELYQTHWLELNRRMENADTAQQKAAFNDFPRPPQAVINASEHSAASSDPERTRDRVSDMVLSSAYSGYVDELILNTHDEVFEDSEIDFNSSAELEFDLDISEEVAFGANPVDATYTENAAAPARNNNDRSSNEVGLGSSGAVATGLAVLEMTEEVDTPTAAAEEDTTLGGYIIKDKLWFFAGASRTNLPQAGYGVEVTADDEQFVAETDDHLSGTTFGGAYLGGYTFTPRDEYERFSYLQRKWRGRASAFTAALSYTQADGSSSGSVPAGGNGTGVVYFDFADDGATGLFYGNAGSDVETSTDYMNFRFSVGRKVYHEITRDWYWGCYHGLFYDYSDTEHEFGITTPSYPDIYTFGRQDLTERYAGVELGPFFGRKFGKVNTFVRPMFNFGYREADLDAQQDTFCGLCAVQNVPIRLDGYDSGFDYGGSLDFGMDMELAEALSLGIVYSAYARNGRSRIVNPESGDDLFVDNQPTRLSTDNSLDQRLVFTIGKSW